MPLAVVRADATPGLGAGHVVRCLALTEALHRHGWKVAFAGVARTRAMMPALSSLPFVALAEGGEREEADLLARHFPGGCDLLVVDHYGRDAAFGAACRAWARRILVVDDLANRPYECDLLLDQTLGRREESYRPWVGAETRLLLGTDYALLRGQFRRQRGDRKRQGAVERILIGFGATDPANVTPRAARAAARVFPGAGIDVVLGLGAPHRHAVERVAAELGERLRLWRQVEEMAPLMAGADLALGAAGSSSWERCCLGLPTVMLVTGDDQREIARALHEKGAALNLGWHEQVTDQILEEALINLARESEHLRHMGEVAAQVCDGLGADRVVEEFRR